MIKLRPPIGYRRINIFFRDQMMCKMTISRPHNYGEGLRNLPMGLTSKSLGLLWRYIKVIRLAINITHSYSISIYIDGIGHHGLPWEKFVRKKVDTSTKERFFHHHGTSWLVFTTKFTRWKCQRAYLHTGFRPHNNHPILATPPQKNSRLYFIEHN